MPISRGFPENHKFGFGDGHALRLAAASVDSCSPRPLLSRASPSTIPGYTHSMKTAISIPDDLFKGAERFAKQTRRSRSQLFSDAIEEYLARHAPDPVTSAMDQTLAQLGESQDDFVATATHRRLEASEW
jgi:predicted transcriptional regulator